MPESRELNIDRSTIAPIIPLKTREVQEKVTDSAQNQPVAPTEAQLRYWWWQRENKLLVGGDRYMESRYEVSIDKSGSPGQGNIHLPVRQVNQVSNDWLTLIILLVVVLMASVRTIWHKYLGRLFHSVINASSSDRLFEEKNSSVSLGIFQLDIIFYLVLSIFIYQWINFYPYDFTYRHFVLYGLSLASVVFYFLLKKIIYRFAGFLVKKQGETEEYLFTMNNFNRITGLVLFPVIILIAYAPFRREEVLFITGGFIVISLYFLLIVRGFVTLVKKQFSIFYLFLYFCTLEFLPLVLLYNVLIKEVGIV